MKLISVAYQSFNVRQHALWALSLASLSMAPTAASAESRGYIISWFATATHNSDFQIDCPRGGNGGELKLKMRQLKELGYSETEATKIVAESGAQIVDPYRTQIILNAKVNGKPVSIYNYPDAAPDPHIETVSGRYAYGFDLGGKPKSKFENPETHEKIDNQLWRALGCLESYRAAPPQKPYSEQVAANDLIDSAPGWSVRLVGDDLSKDGKVTVILDRLTQHVLRNATGEVMSNATYIIRSESNPRSHNVLQGELKDGVLTIKPKDIYLEGEMPFFFEIALRNTHMRLSVKPEKLVGYWGGYLNWRNYVYKYTANPADNDVMGEYHALKKLADSDPDPKTGQNRYISGAFRMEAVPAYLADESGKIVASPAPVTSQVAVTN